MSGVYACRQYACTGVVPFKSHGVIYMRIFKGRYPIVIPAERNGVPRKYHVRVIERYGHL